MLLTGYSNCKLFKQVLFDFDKNMYQTCNSYEDEFEPRTTPKPASRFDCFTLPSVPEVSLIFDKPASCKTVDQNVFTSPYVEPRGLKSKNNVSSPVHADGSYAAWKEQNYLGKPPTSKQFNNSISPKVQHCQNYNTEEVNNRERNNISRRNFNSSSNYEEKETHRESNGNIYKHNHKTRGDNLVHVEQNHNENSIKGNRMDPVSNAPHVVKTYVNNYDTKEKEYSPLVYERKLVTPTFEQQKVPFTDSGESRNFPINSNGSKRNEFPLPTHYLGQQYPYFNANAYPFPQHHLCSPHNNIDSQETVKNLLQIINSQNEQIKSLQTQVDRLLKMQEENLRERKNCSCSTQVQHGQLMKNDENTGYDRVPQNSKQHLHRYEPSKEISNCGDAENVNQTELVLKETQSRQTFMEQKVSIGVMTSFEFTVQNSPFAVDIEDYEKNECQQEKSNLKLCNNVNLHDAGVAHEPLRRYKNSFNRIPSGQLENIVEDSESYMSSSQQQSSNLNASISMKDSDKQACVDTRREIGNRRTESPNDQLCKGGGAKINQSESTPNHIGRSNKEEARNRRTLKMPESQKGIAEYDTLERGNRKTNVSPGTDQRVKLNTQRDIDSVKTNNTVNRSSEYYKNQRKADEAAARRGSCIEDSLILNGGDLKITERPPTPEPSIHVEMQEYSSDDDSEKMKRSSKVGWTFYNNVLGQVNQLLQNSGVINDQQQDPRKMNQNERDETENRGLSTVKVATLEQLKKLGISLSENPEHKESNNSNKMTFDSSYYPRLEHQANMTQATSAVNETNTSMHMKALALKYLTDEQLAELAIQRQGSAAVKHLMLSNVQGTNMSFATMRYLERYQLLPGKNNAQTEDVDKIQVEVPPKFDEKIANTKKSPALQRFPFTQTPRTTCPSKILDISTLKQQPKLL
ncbi:uncharacterized protein LOC143218275 [Lasioglossum baleicum]|uniref:uncharacterized protein LOC143218275 n=1 Tax=Lasioglossum baleicum TaxID=434251 RepID=UPI003FCE676E